MHKIVPCYLPLRNHKPPLVEQRFQIQVDVGEDDNGDGLDDDVFDVKGDEIVISHIKSYRSSQLQLLSR